MSWCVFPMNQQKHRGRRWLGFEKKSINQLITLSKQHLEFVFNPPDYSCSIDSHLHCQRMLKCSNWKKHAYLNSWPLIFHCIFCKHKRQTPTHALWRDGKQQNPICTKRHLMPSFWVVCDKLLKHLRKAGWGEKKREQYNYGAIRLCNGHRARNAAFRTILPGSEEPALAT